MHQSFNQRVHFYYCILVALKIHVKTKNRAEREGKITFFSNGCVKRRTTTSFTRISPAKSNGYAVKLSKAGHDTDLEPMLEFVYATARRAEMLKDAD